MGTHRISVLMTCHNRCEKTLTCLESLLRQVGLGESFVVTVHLVDAGSTDGTAGAVRARYPDVNVVEADASIYWGTGTAMAARSAAQDGADYHLWLNDDVVLRPDALNRLIGTAERQRTDKHIIVGQLCDASGAPSYGGFRRGRRPLAFEPVGITESDVACDTLNGNVVLVSAMAAERLGHIDRAFPHAMGDIDYGLRATAAGIPVVQAGGVHGECERNPHPPASVATSRRERLRGETGVKRLPPRAWWTFCHRHAGPLALAYFLKPYGVALSLRPARSVASVRTEPARGGVVHVLNEIRASGAEMMLLSDAMADNRLIDRVIATGASRGPMATAFADLGVEVVHLPFRPTLPWAMRFVSALQGIPIVHVHVERASFWVTMLARLCGHFVVRSLHSVFAFDGYLRRKRAIQRRIMEAVGVRFVAVSREVASNERYRFGVTPIVVPNSPDEKYFELGANREYRARIDTIVTVGNCEQRKNHMAVLGAVDQLRRAEIMMYYIHIGTGSPHEEQEREFCRQNNLNHLVSFVGQDDPAAYMASADILVMPSLREGLSIAVLEGLAAGIPVLIGDSPGMEEFKSIDGLWWSEPTAPALAEAIRIIISTPAGEVQERARRSRQIALERFSPSSRRSLMGEVYGRTQPRTTSDRGQFDRLSGRS